MNMHDAVKAANGGRIYRKATGQVILFRRGKRLESNTYNIFPTLEDIMAFPPPPPAKNPLTTRRTCATLSAIREGTAIPAR